MEDTNLRSFGLLAKFYNSQNQSSLEKSSPPSLSQCMNMFAPLLWLCRTQGNQTNVPRQTPRDTGALGSRPLAVLPVVMSSSISSSISWVSSISLVLCTTSFRRHRYPFSTVPTKRLLKCLLMDSTSTNEERRPVGTGKSCCKSSDWEYKQGRFVSSKDNEQLKSRKKLSLWLAQSRCSMSVLVNREQELRWREQCRTLVFTMVNLNTQGTKGQSPNCTQGAIKEGSGSFLYLWDSWGHSPAADQCSGLPPPEPVSGLFPKQDINTVSVTALPTTLVTSTTSPELSASTKDTLWWPLFHSNDPWSWIFAKLLSKKPKVITFMLRDCLKIGKSLRAPKGRSSPSCRMGYLGDEVAHVGQDSPCCQVDFPVSGSDELLVESQVFSSALTSYTQFVQVTAIETDRALWELKQLQQSTSSLHSFTFPVFCHPSPPFFPAPFPSGSEEGPLRKPKLHTWEEPKEQNRGWDAINKRNKHQNMISDYLGSETIFDWIT